MRNPERIPEVLKALEAYWRTLPDCRLGQLLVNLTPEPQDIFYLEDDALLEILRNQLPP